VRGPERWKMRFLHREIAAMHESGSGFSDIAGLADDARSRGRSGSLC
jgi:hypothetical protein